MDKGIQFHLVECRRQDDIAVLLVNDPPANALTYDLVCQLEDIFFELSQDSAVRAVVISGAGDRFFSGGVNIGMLCSVSAHFNSNFILYAAEVFESIASSELLIVAAINGHVTGGGLELALIADKRVAVDAAYNFGFPEVKLGVIPGLGGTQRLSKIIGPRKALDLITQGAFIPVAEAKALGIVDAVLPKERFLERAIDYTRTLLADMPPLRQAEGGRRSWAPPESPVAEYARAGSIGVITLSSCETVSALHALHALNTAVVRARLDDDAEAIVLKCDGGTLQLGDTEPDATTLRYAEYVFRRIEGTPRLCILTSGWPVGTLASELALACDYWLIPAQPEKADTQISISHDSNRIAKYASLLKGLGTVTQRQVLELGLAQPLDSANWPENALDWVRRFVSPRGASKAIGYAKLAIVESSSLSPHAGMLLERHLQEQLFRSHDASEGMKAYLEKRSPIFKGE